ncbi:ComF family protein [Nakamurella endophytica]|uniref:Amidophosphoribosyltransferase n=1 Tax=Nakamurella endophytica TaxID=1748367 RepID=A0A917SKL7_9ACTN|nr:ComF family protein [Nakamurella endophytica]GGL85997.1 hypothetical protein GCM10011594_02110 [Nakamurella endophytica]
MTGSGTLRQWASAAADLVLPRPCPGCGDPPPWCARCAAVLEGRLRPVRLSDAALDAAAGLPLPPVLALARYAGPVRAAVIAGKERGRSDLPPRLGSAIGRALAGSVAIRARRPAGGGTVWLVPAPSRRSAARSRGGDPVTAMARGAAEALAAAGVAAGVAPCLRTAGHAADSVGLSPGERVANLAGRVRVVPAAGPTAGAEIVLLDDVVTSGATAVAALRALADAGIRTGAVVAVAAAAPWVRTP